MRVRVLASTVALLLLASCSLLWDTSDLTDRGGEVPADAARDAPAPAPTPDADASFPSADGQAPPSYFEFLDASNWEGFSIGGIDAGGVTSFQGGVANGPSVVYVGSALPTAYAPSFLVFDRGRAFDDPTSWHWESSRGHKLGIAAEGAYVYFAPGATTLAARWGAGSASPVETFDLRATWLGPAVADGARVYFLPSLNPNAPSSQPSTAYRYDSARPFGDAFAWTSVDLAKLDAGNPIRAGSFYGSGALYAFPYSGCAVYRYDVNAPFGDPSSWTMLASPFCGRGRVGGAAFDGRFAYVVLASGALPDGGALASRLIIRFDTSVPSGPAAFTAMDLDRLGKITSLPVGAVFDGRYLHVTTNGGAAYRYDSTQPFDDTASWSGQELKSVAPGRPSYVMSGVTFDGEWVYYLPGGASMLALRFHARTPRATP